MSKYPQKGIRKFMTDEQISCKVRELYGKDKVFKKLFDLMFSDFGWAATEIDKDIMKIYKIVRKYRKVRK
jgi:transketolase N-terminal domain/subunit